MIPIHFHILKAEASLSYEKGTILELFLNQLKNKLSYIMFQKLNSEYTQEYTKFFCNPKFHNECKWNWNQVNSTQLRLQSCLIKELKDLICSNYIFLWSVNSKAHLALKYVYYSIVSPQGGKINSWV